MVGTVIKNKSKKDSAVFKIASIHLLRQPGIEIADETGKLPLNVGEVQICAALPIGSPA